MIHNICISNKCYSFELLLAISLLFYCIFIQINAALVSITLQKCNNPKLLNNIGIFLKEGRVAEQSV